MIPEPALVFWILGAPMVLALIDLMRTPKVHLRHTAGERWDGPVRTGPGGPHG